jgi:hypothetical protein
MSVSETNVGTYLKSFFGDFLTLLCGPLSVPFTAISLWFAPSAKVLWACLAVIGFFVASYRVWRKERICSSQVIEGLKEQIVNLGRKPYDEELGKQAAALIAKLSAEGRNMLRNLVTHEPLEMVGITFLK